MDRRGLGHDALLARGRRFQYATIGWNVMEVFVTIGLGLAAGSLALVAFGLDSLVEVFASVVAVWHIAHHHDTNRTRTALKLVGVAFAVLAGYLVVAAIYNLTAGSTADSSPLRDRVPRGHRVCDVWSRTGEKAHCGRGRERTARRRGKDDVP